MTPYISIIVPVYKVEAYLDRCVQSLMQQTYADIEILLVDDGSPDNCPRLCEEYSRQDERVRVIHKENGGLSDARNAGLAQAAGEYVLFVDSDDYITLDACENFMERLRKDGGLDIVAGNADRVYPDHTEPMRHIPVAGVVSGKEYLQRQLEAHTMYMTAWLNLYRREFLMINQLRFQVGLLHEDEEFTPRAFLKAKWVAGLNTVFYAYLCREGSISTNRDFSKNAMHILRICKELEPVFAALPEQKLKALLNDHLVEIYLNAFQVGRMQRREFTSWIDKKFLRGKAYFRRNRLKVALFRLNKHLYFHVNRILKKSLSR